MVAHELECSARRHALHEMTGDLDATDPTQHVSAQPEDVGDLGLINRQHEFLDHGALGHVTSLGLAPAALPILDPRRTSLDSVNTFP